MNCRKIDKWFEHEHSQWVWALTNSNENGIQPLWTYKCAYCGTEITGKDVIEDPKCRKCGALLNE